MRPIERPLPYSTLTELARYRAIHQPTRKAFTFLRSETAAAHLTFAELDIRARRIAARLQQHFEPGDRVLLACATELEFITAFFGCLYARVVAVLAPPPSGTTEVARLKRIAGESGAVGLCTGTVGFNVGHLGLSLPSLHRQLCCLTITADEKAPSPEAWVEPDIDPQSVAFVQYTSGSTGTSRGVMVSHANVLHNQRLMESALDSSGRTRAVSWLPPYHDMGLIGHVVQPLHLGITSVLLSNASFIVKPARWLQAITDHRATISGGPNFAYELCIRRITGDQMRTLDLGCWDVAFNGAEMVRAETLERFADKFAPCGFRREAFVSCYGMTEATLFVSASPTATFPAVCRLDGDALQQHRLRPPGGDTHNVRSVVSCGHAPQQRVLIVNPETRTLCPTGRVGEIWIKGESVAPGYWNDAEATRTTFHAQLAGRNDGPYLRTGDLGFIRDGQLYLTGRLHDLVLIGGKHYYPGDIEDAVRASHPALREGEAAAFSIDFTGESQLVVLHELQRRELRRLPHADVETAARSAVLAEFGVSLQEMIFVPEGTLPKTSSGKIRRHALRDAYLRNASLPAASIADSGIAGAAVREGRGASHRAAQQFALRPGMPGHSPTRGARGHIARGGIDKGS